MYFYNEDLNEMDVQLIDIHIVDIVNNHQLYYIIDKILSTNRVYCQKISRFRLLSANN